MSQIWHFIQIILKHDDHALRHMFVHFGPWAYVVLFAIVFCETGLVVTPFLPGDSLLLVAGSLALMGVLDPWIVFFLLIAAALCGDNVNYFLGSKLGMRLFRNEKSKLFNRRNLQRTHAFFEKYGGRTVIVARFLPIFRTFTPFVAGMGGMPYRRFIGYSLLAASLWVSLFEAIGYFASRWAREHMIYVLAGIILVSAVPAVFEFMRHYREHKEEKERERRALEDKPLEVAPATSEVA